LEEKRERRRGGSTMLEADDIVKSCAAVGRPKAENSEKYG
jgi:hypothetical protein